MLSRVMIISFSLMLGTGTPCRAMEKIDPDKSLLTLSLPQLRVLSSAEEVYLYGEKFSQAHENNDYQLIFELAFPEPIVNGIQTHSDIESYLYSRTLALSAAYKDLALKSQLNPKEAIKYYISVVKEVNKYLASYGNFESSIKSFNDRMVWHRYFLFDLVGDAYHEIGSLKNAPSYPLEQRITPIRNAMTAYENALVYNSKSMKIPYFRDVAKGSNDNLSRIEFNLLSTYCTLAQLVPVKEAALFLKKARQIYQGAGAKWDKSKLKAGSSTIDIAEKIIADKQLSLVPQGTKKVEAIRSKKYLKNQNIIIEEVNKLCSEVNLNQHLSTSVQQKNMTLCSLCDSQIEVYDHVAPKIAKGLIDIETMVASHLNLDVSSGLSKEQLAIIYEHLPTLLTAEEMIATFWKYIPAFLYINDLDGGIARVDLLKGLEVKENGTTSYLIRLIAASMKNLKGDHDEWLSLEAELMTEVREIKQQKEVQKQEKKDKSEQLRLNALRLEIAENHKKKSAEVITSKQARPIVATKPKLVVSEPDNLTVVDNTISHKESKLEKQKRHKLAELRRQQNAAVSKVNVEQKQPNSETSPPKPSKAMELEAIVASSAKTLAELYDLSSLPLKIDQEIEQGSWCFTRDQFQTYLEAMGCICKSGHGVHTKASLPKAMHVMQGDNLITILSDFGGALTLPLWDKDYVPVYLITQILEARKKLLALKIKALNYTFNEEMKVAF